jgi:hypothetical protein
MGQIMRCPTCAGKVHIVIGERSVCVGSKDAALGAIRHAVQLGLVNVAESGALQAEINRFIGLGNEETGLTIAKSCGVSHTFVRGIMDTLDVMCGTGESHPDDVN